MERTKEMIEIEYGKCSITGEGQSCCVMPFETDGSSMQYFYLTPTQAQNLANALLKFVERSKEE